MVVATSAHSRGVLGLAIGQLSPPVVCSSSYDGTVKLWRLSDQGSLSLLHEIGDDSRDGAVFSLEARETGDGGLLVCAGSFSRRVRVWRCHGETSSQLKLPPELQWTSTEHTGWVRALAIGSRGRGARAPSSLYSIGCNRILGWSLGSGTTASPRQFDSETALYEDAACIRSKDILCLAHADEEERLACGSVDGAVRCWSTADWAISRPLPPLRASRWYAHADRVADVAWGENGVLFSAGYDGFVRAWRPPDDVPSARGDDPEQEGQPAWRLLAERRVAAEGGRALALAVLPHSGEATGEEGREEVVLCGTSTGEVVSLAAEDLAIDTRIPIGDGSDARVTAIVPVADRGAVVVGDSEGGLHVCDLRHISAPEGVE